MFEVVYHPEVPRTDIPSLDHDARTRVRKAIETRLTRAPQDYGKPLSANLRTYWSLRVGDYRVVYAIDGDRVRVLQISHRRDAYDAGVIEARRRGWMR